jgi:hypothetical protein
LGGATGDGNKSGNAFIRAIDCCAVKKQDKKVIFKKVVFLQPVIKQTLILLWDSQLLCSVITFVQQWRPHDLLENAIKLCPLKKGCPPGI